MKIYPAVEFAKLEFNEAKGWAVRNLIPTHGLILLYADPKTGKTILAAQLAQALASRMTFLDKPVLNQPWKVLYVQADEPEGEWKQQLNLIGATEGWATGVEAPGLLADPGRTAALKAQVKDYNFLILDSLSSLFGYPDLNNSVVAGHCIKKIKELFTGPILLIHHKRKGQAGVPDTVVAASAGHHVITAAASVLLNLSKLRLEALGRTVKQDLNLSRTENGLWQISKRSIDGFSL